MPIKLAGSSSEENVQARIEIIPLIDIMFFLLASFMLVSLSMVNLKSLKLDLPASSTATTEQRKDFADVSVDQWGGIFLDKKPAAANELARLLAARRRENPALRILISGDRTARHGDVMRALDLVRQAGIDKVAFETADVPAGESGGSGGSGAGDANRDHAGVGPGGVKP